MIHYTSSAPGEVMGRKLKLKHIYSGVYSVICTGVAFFLVIGVTASAADFVSAEESAAVWLCRPVLANRCTLEGCAAVTPTVWVQADLERSRYSRCDAKGCDSYDVEPRTSGAFVHIARPASGSLFKMTRDGGAFLEVVTLLDTVLIYHGRCEAQ